MTHGRILDVADDGLVLLSDGERRRVACAHAGARPGDLVRIDDGVATVVFRPTRDPFARGAEVPELEARRAYLSARERAVTAVRAYFARERFVELDTPSIATSPGLDVHLHAFTVRDSVNDAPQGYLITSPEYHMKRALVAGIERCFQFARCFRAAERGRRHEPEFTMLEWYRAWAPRDAMLADTLAALRAVAADAPSLALAHAPPRVLTVRDAFAEHAPDLGDPIALAARDEDAYFLALSDRIEPRLGASGPEFLTEFPARHASLARLCPHDPSVCDRFELYVGGVELSNGFVELTDPVEQRVRLERDQRDRHARGLPVYPVDERFLAALEQGMPPSVGNALGFDRLVALACGAPSIADVMLFPDDRR